MRKKIGGSAVMPALQLERAALASLVVALLGGIIEPHPAAAADVLDVRGLQPLPDSSLDKLRGGFRVGPFDLAIGITVSTAINGTPVLHTSFNVIGPNRIDNLQMRGPQGPIGPQGQIGPKDPVGPTGLTGPDNITIGEVPGGIQLSTGGTQILHQIGNGVLTQIMNAADGQKISHSTTINLAATNFAEVIGGAAIRAQVNNLAMEAARIGLIAN